MAKEYQRTPRGYNGSMTTSHKLEEFLPGMMKKLQERYEMKPELILQMWRDVIGEELSPMTSAYRFEEGILYVKVKNSTLMSLLNNPKDKQRILDSLRKRAGRTTIHNIVFKIG